MFSFDAAGSVSTGWSVLTRLGEAQILLPAMLLAVAWLAWRRGAVRLATIWLLATLLAALLTTASKVAFIGYGLGLAALDFTGISGHAMFAAAIVPPLTTLCAGGLPPRWRAVGVVAGYGLAAAVAVSRVMVGAHSWSEVLAGFALGSLASAVVLRGGQLPRLALQRWAPVALLAWLVLTVGQAPPPRTHDWVTRLSLASSGRPIPYSRSQMHRDFRLRVALPSVPMR